MKKIYNNIFAIILFTLLANNVLAQGGANSPYTILGSGRNIDLGSIRNTSMGGVGVAMGTFQQSNMLNPALLTHNKFALFEASFFGEQRNLSEGDMSSEGFGANLNYLNFAFPGSKNWTMSVGLRPMTTVNYSINRIDEAVFNTETNNEGAQPIRGFTTIQEAGIGGLNQVYFSNGVEITDNIVIGLEAGYVFSNIERDRSSTLIDGQYTIASAEKINYGQFIFKPGIFLRHPLNKGGEVTGKAITFGATYQPKTKYGFKYVEAKQRNTTGGVTLIEYPLSEESDLEEYFPAVATVGVGFEKRGKYSIGLDYENRNLSDEDLAENAQLPTTNRFQLKTSNRVSLGGEITPDYLSASSYWKRITFRGGFRFEQLDYQNVGANASAQSIALDDISFSAGFSLPVGMSSLTFAGIYGWTNEQGNADAGITEEYFKIHFALTINDRFWFIKRKVN